MLQLIYEIILLSIRSYSARCLSGDVLIKRYLCCTHRRSTRRRTAARRCADDWWLVVSRYSIDRLPAGRGPPRRLARDGRRGGSHPPPTTRLVRAVNNDQSRPLAGQVVAFQRSTLTS